MARRYHELLKTKQWAPSLGLTRERWDVHAVFLPEMKLDLAAEAKRLKALMDEQGNVNIFLSEGAGVPEIIAEMEAAGQEVQRDPFGHVKLDTSSCSTSCCPTSTAWRSCAASTATSRPCPSSSSPPRTRSRTAWPD